VNKVVVDASVALRWVLADEKEARVDALLEQWLALHIEMIAPPLFQSEVTNAIYLSLKRRRLTMDEAEGALAGIMHLGVQLIEPSDLYARGLRLAVAYGMTNAYDALYLSLAEIEGCEFWTADDRLAATIHPSLPWLKVV
jgi:predicted nucleic acid-binding protein